MSDWIPKVGDMVEHKVMGYSAPLVVCRVKRPSWLHPFARVRVRRGAWESLYEFDVHELRPIKQEPSNG